MLTRSVTSMAAQAAAAGPAASRPLPAFALPVAPAQLNATSVLKQLRQQRVAPVMGRSLSPTTLAQGARGLSVLSAAMSPAASRMPAGEGGSSTSTSAAASATATTDSPPISRIARPAPEAGLGSSGKTSSSSSTSAAGLGASSATSTSGSGSSSGGSQASTSSPSGGGGPGAGSAPKPLLMQAGAFVLPHPDKVAKGGEDWYFLSSSQRAIGVADGVGGWAEIGVDAGAYARMLMNHAGKVADAAGAERETKDGPVLLSPQEILERAYFATTVRGSSTACVLCVNGNVLRASNLGDSGFLIIRNGKVHFHSPQQQHDFNFPFQIGSMDSMSDSPTAAQQFEMELQPGDVIVVGTDGLWDNCFDEEVEQVIKYCRDSGFTAERSAQVLAYYARHRASDSKFASPFAYAAYQAGFAYIGGKMDDITTLVAFVVPQDAATAPAAAAAAGGAATPAPQSKL